jgi:sugar (pentulose or hexulose) kinase
MALFIGLDIGTSCIKGVLISAEGISLARAEAETSLVYPAPGRIEFSPVHHYDTVCRVIRELAANAADKEDIKGVCLSGATGNALLLDKNMRPMTNSISWMDKRAGNDYYALLPNLDPRKVYETAGWPWGNGFPLTQFAWHKKHCPDIYKNAVYYVMQMTYVYYRLTNSLGIEPSTATTFYLQEQINRCYHRPFLKALDIVEDSLPPILPSGSVLGTVTADAALKTGLSASTQVVLGTFDHPSAARGTGVLQPGDLLLSCGTSWVGFYPVKDRSPGLANNLLIDPFLSPQGPWAALFSLSKVGNIVDGVVDLITGDI